MMSKGGTLMKKFFLTLFLILLAVSAFAHPPTDIKLEYNSATRMLTITANHPLQNNIVSDPARHYLREITVSVNGKIVITETLVFQQSPNGEISSFLLNVKAGDRISVRAVCNITGVKTAEITVK